MPTTATKPTNVHVNVPQATYVLKSSQLEVEDRNLDDQRVKLAHGSKVTENATVELIQTLRLLGRSSKRFTEEHGC
jgi:hypothetical protein